ncbi:hypothetical protein N568_0109390 [Lactococcus garvieae TRF1]|uniref:Uncharacterized protein n=1 Tax=Lactococcus garvieae TRF1 TaxID=1380772 RepID=V8AMJ8_9LACT|nr:hypothetical protein N568_0109390 [Lactococcus garvieae TRF1]
MDAIASIVYGFTEETYLGFKEFLGLNSESEEDYFSGFVEEIRIEEIGGVNSGEILDEKVSRKFEEHIRLCCHQRDFMTKSAQNANELAEQATASFNATGESISQISVLLSDLKQTVHNVNNQALQSSSTAKTAKKIAKSAEKSSNQALELSESSKTILDEVSDTKTSIYAEFIAILGVFTAIAFVLMGSIQTFGTVFSKVDNPSSGSIGFAVEAGAVFLIIIITVIVVLFSGMKRVLSKKSGPIPWWTVILVIVVVISLVLIGLALLLKNPIPQA